jgi:hypothetical protein
VGAVWDARERQEKKYGLTLEPLDSRQHLCYIDVNPNEKEYDMSQLKFSVGNSKLENTKIFSLPAGWSCPAAKLCLSKADRNTGRITDGKHCKWRCFGATSEAKSPNLRKQSWHNFDLLIKKSKTVKSMADLIDSSMGEWRGLVRIHSTGGDFFCEEYMQAWAEVARRRPGRIEWFNGKAETLGTVFYAYTKALNVTGAVDLPDNFRLTASYGGVFDDLVPDCGLKSVRVVFSAAEAKAMDLEVDHDDTHAWAGDRDFALIVHGTQPAGSEAGKALSANRRAGEFAGYSKNKKKVKA